MSLSTVFESFRGRKGEHERLSAMKLCLGLGRISPPAVFTPVTPLSEIGSANCSATRTLRFYLTV